MNKLPAKQIYLLFIIIVGIITLSVYSTYALFTFESSTDDVVSIHTPKSLTISENVYEYQQITVEPNAVLQADVDIYNTFDYDVCYSIWYKIVGDESVQNKIEIFEKTKEDLSTSGVLSPKTNTTITIVIINDNDKQIKINLGTISSSKNDTSCELNLSENKNIITSSYKNTDTLTTKILEQSKLTEENESGYLTYKDITQKITFEENATIFVSKNFTYENEVFTLINSEELTMKAFVDKHNLSIEDNYFCLDSSECSILYKIKTINPESNSYELTKYDKLIGYQKGTSGLKKINTMDYVYYGDNPNNFIYYNCENSDNLETCELWRIIGFFYDEVTKKYYTKIIRNNSIGKYQFDYKITSNINESTNNWNNSNLNQFLNKEYKLKNNYDIYINKYQQSLENISNLEFDVKNMKVNDEYVNSPVRLLNLSDYLYASSCSKNKINEYTKECLSNNWLNNIEIGPEWTLTSKKIEEILLEENTDVLENNNTENSQVEEDVTEELTENNTNIEEPLIEENNYIINYIYSIGDSITETDVSEKLEVRPVVFLKSRMLLLDGDGSLERPYIIK